MICLTETKLSCNIRNEALNIENYNIWRKDRKHKQGGGVVILTSKEIGVQQLNVDALRKGNNSS